MGTTGKVRKKKTAEAVETADSASGDEPVAAQLMRSVLYRRLPAEVRRQVDEAILLRPSGCATLQAIAAKHELKDKHQVSLAALKTYAGKLEQLARPVVTSRLLTQVLACLPEQHRWEMIAGGEVLLLSRLVQSLSTETASSLTVADLAKLASVLSSVAGKTQASRTKLTTKKKANQKDDGADEDGLPADENQLAAAVHDLYGLSWPPDEKPKENRPVQSI